MEEINMNEGDE